MNFKITVGEHFKNGKHINKHLNALFRTDKEQKWTNDITNKNLYINFYESLEIRKFPIKLKDRIKIKNQLIQNILENKRNLKKLEMSYAYFGFITKEELYKFLNKIVQLHNRYVIFAIIVIHFDQRMIHIHFIYFNFTSKVLQEYYKDYYLGEKR